MNEELYDDDNNVIEEKDNITPKELLKFAKWILFVLALLFLISSIGEFISPSNNVFEVCKTIIPSIATSVIGFYFGRNS